MEATRSRVVTYFETEAGRYIHDSGRHILHTPSQRLPLTLEDLWTMIQELSSKARSQGEEFYIRQVLLPPIEPSPGSFLSSLVGGASTHTFGDHGDPREDELTELLRLLESRLASENSDTDK